MVQANETPAVTRVPETLDTLRLTDTQFEMLTPRARAIVSEHGFLGLRQINAIVRESTSLERNIHFGRVYAERTAASEMGIVDVESHEVEADETAHLADELAALRAENDDLREKCERQEHRINDLLARLAESAAAVHAGQQ